MEKPMKRNVLAVVIGLILLTSCQTITKDSEKETIAKGNFNSIKVRLKLVSGGRFPSQKSDFNSIKVRLKHLLNVTHKGRPLFQFHKGTIKTKKLKRLVRALYYFNSIKVRLKLRF